MIHDTDAITPIQEQDGYYIKCDNLFGLHGKLGTYTGTKARVAAILAKGKSGLTTIHTSQHPQGPLVAAVAKMEGIPCRIHTTEKLARAMFGSKPHGATVIAHGSKEVIHITTMSDANLTGFTFMPVNMDCTEALESIKKQCVNIPGDTNRIIVRANDDGAVAMAILQGMEAHGKKTTMVVHGPNTNGIAAHFRLFGPDTWHEWVHIQAEAPTPMGKDLVWMD